MVNSNNCRTFELSNYLDSLDRFGFVDLYVGSDRIWLDS